MVHVAFFLLSINKLNIFAQFRSLFFGLSNCYNKVVESVSPVI